MAYQAADACANKEFSRIRNTQSMLVTVQNTITKHKAREMILNILLASGTSAAP
jgi:hypothetical protein